MLWRATEGLVSQRIGLNVGRGDVKDRNEEIDSAIQVDAKIVNLDPFIHRMQKQELSLQAGHATDAFRLKAEPISLPRPACVH